MARTTTGKFRVSNRDLDSSSKLLSHLREEGYLFFRGVLDLEAVLRTKMDFIRVLQGQGAVVEGASEAIWTGACIDSINDEDLYALRSYVDLIGSAALRTCLEAVFGEPVRISPGIGIRYALPEDAKYLTPAHQDHFFIRETSNFCMLWVPVMAIAETGGGLSIARGASKHGLFEHQLMENVYSYGFKGRKQKGIPLSAIEEPWLSAEYEPGDLLLFQSLAVHRALPNSSDRIRLSLNTLCQPASAPRIWQAEQTIPQLRQYRKDLQRLAFAEGASEELFETLHIEMMKRGLPAETEAVKKVMSEISAKV